MSKFIEIEKVRAYYDEFTGNIRLISKDKKLKGKPFQITLSRDSGTVDSLYEIFEEENKISENALIRTMPKLVELSQSDPRKEVKTLPNGDPSDNRLNFSLGETGTNRIFLNLENSPHSLIWGNAGYGKTELLKTIGRQVINDGKGLFWCIEAHDGEYSQLDFRDNLDKYAKSEEDIANLFEDLEKLIDERLEAMKSLNVNDWRDLTHRLPPVFFVIDDFGMLGSGSYRHQKMLEKWYISVLQKVSSLGRSAGVFMFISSQRFISNMIPGNVLANFSNMIIFGQVSPDDEFNVFNHGESNYHVLRNHVGRAVIKSAGKDPILFQSYISS